jgi:hypothetical protein
MPQPPKSTPGLTAEDQVIFSKIVVTTVTSSTTKATEPLGNTELVGLMLLLFLLKTDGKDLSTESIKTACNIPRSKLLRLYSQLSELNLLTRHETRTDIGRGKKFIYDFTPELLEQINLLKSATRPKKS